MKMIAGAASLALGRPSFARSEWIAGRWSQLESWLVVRRQLLGRCAVLRDPRHDRGSPVGVVFGPQAAGTYRSERGRAATVAPHQLRHAHAIEMAHEGVSLVVIQRQLGHANLGLTSIYLQGIDTSEIIHTIHSRPAPVIPATAGLRDL